MRRRGPVNYPFMQLVRSTVLDPRPRRSQHLCARGKASNHRHHRTTNTLGSTITPHPFFATCHRHLHWTMILRIYQLQTASSSASWSSPLFTRLTLHPVVPSSLLALLWFSFPVVLYCIVGVMNFLISLKIVYKHIARFIILQLRAIIKCHG